MELIICKHCGHPNPKVYSEVTATGDSCCGICALEHCEDCYEKLVDVETNSGKLLCVGCAEESHTG